MGKKVKVGEIEVDTTDLGFSPTDEPTPEQVVQAFGEQAKKIAFWKKEAEKGQKREKDRIEMAEKQRALECQILMEGAVKSFKIKPYQADFYTFVYKHFPKETREFIENLEREAYLTEETGLSGDVDGPSDPLVELAVLSAQKIANNPKLDQVSAQQMVLRENHSLNDRIRAFQIKEKESERKGGRD
jgi:hypothetical protein